MNQKAALVVTMVVLAAGQGLAADFIFFNLPEATSHIKKPFPLGPPRFEYPADLVFTVGNGNPAWVWRGWKAPDFMGGRTLVPARVFLKDVPSGGSLALDIRVRSLAMLGARRPADFLLWAEPAADIPQKFAVSEYGSGWKLVRGGWGVTKFVGGNVFYALVNLATRKATSHFTENENIIDAVGLGTTVSIGLSIEYVRASMAIVRLGTATTAAGEVFTLANGLYILGAIGATLPYSAAAEVHDRGRRREALFKSLQAVKDEMDAGKMQTRASRKDLLKSARDAWRMQLGNSVFDKVFPQNEDTMENVLHPYKGRVPYTLTVLDMHPDRWLRNPKDRATYYWLGGQ